jgi:hypothetical protein
LVNSALPYIRITTKKPKSEAFIFEQKREALAPITIDLLPKDSRGEISRFRARKMKSEETYLS